MDTSDDITWFRIEVNERKYQESEMKWISLSMGLKRSFFVVVEYYVDRSLNFYGIFSTTKPKFSLWFKFVRMYSVCECVEHVVISTLKKEAEVKIITKWDH